VAAYIETLVIVPDRKRRFNPRSLVDQAAAPADPTANALALRFRGFFGPEHPGCTELPPADFVADYGVGCSKFDRTLKLFYPNATSTSAGEEDFLRLNLAPWFAAGSQVGQTIWFEGGIRQPPDCHLSP